MQKENSKLLREYLSLAGEYAVAAELCKRGMYAQLTIGNHKQADILVEADDLMLRISVKTKQKYEWPKVAGINKKNEFLVFVDMKGKSPAEMPDFYILDCHDWKKIVSMELRKRKGSVIGARGNIEYEDGWKGKNIRLKEIERMKDKWEKIIQ